MKDNRKTYSHHPITANGNTAHFDGKFDPKTNTLKVYRYYGDINIMDEAFQNFAIDNKIDTVII